MLADHLPLRTEVKSHPDADWMARPACLPELFRELVPAWDERWLRRAPDRQETLAPVVEGEEHTLALGPDDVRLTESAIEATRVELTSRALTQLVFGYRPIGWVAGQPGVSVPNEALALLETLFPPVKTWIPGTDSF